ncbi:hypothetical protein [Planotetraspora mira]|uniref:Uncharacterized protein n=1 Tax=Planotetraspora mira TaxID=58121 RepID=A0A8J3TR63_9ACTN|nr:hypothetical protein [Planotetraspora mira]GII30587.1 hypothetical protein Pmi06nite_40290 [Planotetraspora mira]
MRRLMFAATAFLLVGCQTSESVQGQAAAAGAAAAAVTSTDPAAPKASPTPKAVRKVKPKPKPKPKPTPTVTRMASRSGFPTEATTGVPSGTRLTVVTGDQVFSAGGQTIVGKDFHGFVKVRGKNITFRNCIFRGRATSDNAGLLDTESGINTVVEDSEFVPSHPSATIDGIWAKETRISRVNVHGSVDGIKADSDTLVEDSYIHDMRWFAHDPNQGGGPTHNDGVQSFGGEARVTLRHNRIDMSGLKEANAAWQSSARDSLAEGNLFDGGGCTLNFSHQVLNGSLTGIRLVGNRFGRNSFFDCPILLSTKSFLAENRGNVWNDTGGPIPAPQRHD